MRVRHRRNGAERTVELDSRLDGFTMADLARALGGELDEPAGGTAEGDNKLDAESADGNAGGAESADGKARRFECTDGGAGVCIDGCWHSPDTPLSSVSIWEGALLEIAPGCEQSPSQSPEPQTGGSSPSGALVVTAGLRAGTRLELSSSREWVIGRSEGCDVVLDDPSVSRRHARLTLRGPGGRPVVGDLGSRNGTVVAGGIVRAPTRVPAGADCTPRRHLPAVAGQDRRCSSRRARRPRRRGGKDPLQPSAAPPPPISPAPLLVPAEPPPRPEPEPLSWAGIVLPVVAGLVLAVLWNPFMAVFAALGPLITIGTWLERRRRAGRTHQRAATTLP